MDHHPYIRNSPDNYRNYLVYDLQGNTRGVSKVPDAVEDTEEVAGNRAVAFDIPTNKEDL